MAKQRALMQQRIFFCSLIGIIFMCLPIPVFSQDPAIFDSFTSTKKALKGSVFKVIQEIQLFQCYKECFFDQNKFCSSVNFYPSNGRCELNFASHISHKLEEDEGATYIFNLAQREDIAKSGIWRGPGGSDENPVKTCKDLKVLFPGISSGNYWLDLDLEGSIHTPFLGYCDMETDGGGWTLVWSFTFSMYNNFNSHGNYIKPFPQNMEANALKKSSTPPMNETDMNAIDFNMWETIGSEVLIKSNINNWVAFAPASGNLVIKRGGNLKGRFIKQIVTEMPECKEFPGKIVIGSNGINIGGQPRTSGKRMYYFVHGNDDWPTHDPCALNKPNQKKNVDNPRSNVYLRELPQGK